MYKKIGFFVLLLFYLTSNVVGQYKLANNTSVVFQWDWNTTENGVASTFLLEHDTTKSLQQDVAYAFSPIQVVAGTNTESSPVVIQFPQNIERIYYRVSAVDSNDVVGHPSLPIYVDILKPIISFFIATPASILSGQSSLLEWSVIDSAAVEIDNGVGAVPQTGSLTVSPVTTTTYSMTASNNGLTDTTTTTVSVTAQTIGIQSLTLNKSSVRYGQMVRATVVLDAPAPSAGQLVTAESSDATLAKPQDSIMIPAGTSTGSFQIATNRNPGSKTTKYVMITARVNNTLKSVVLTLTK